MRKLAIILAATALAASAKTGNIERLYPNEFNLDQVEILDGPFRHAMDLNVATLLRYDADRLMAPFYIEAGMEPKAAPFENWAGLDGHVTGHYLSALAIHYAATGDVRLLDRLKGMLAEIAAIQEKTGGYVGGVPQSDECWSELRGGNVKIVTERWVPWYNMHKVYAGLRDAYIYAGCDEALPMFLCLCYWGVDVVAGLDDKQMEKMLDTEFGGMNEVYADAYDLTGDERYLDTAIRFSHRRLLDSMAEGRDNLDNRHANTQVPKAVGYQRVAEMCAKAGRPAEAEKFRRAADFFWQTVVNNRSLALGGNSRREYFPAADDCHSYLEEREGPESCNTNNMLKLTEGLFRMAPSADLADFYERALYNHILSTQHPDHGGFVYFTPARPAHYRVYSQPNCAMWCCVGTGMENHGKYGQFIYTREGDSTLDVNLFIPSRLTWGDFEIEQRTAFPYEESTRLTVTRADRPRFLNLRIRRPSWADGFKVTLNGEEVKGCTVADGYVSLPLVWREGDVVEVSLPMDMRLEEMPNVGEYVAIMRGPILLAAKTSAEDLAGLVADDSRWGHIAKGKLIPQAETPALIGERAELLDALRRLEPVEGRPMHFHIGPMLAPPFSDFELQPFAEIHDSRYMMYWPAMTPAEWAVREEQMRLEEAERLRIDALTVDAVNFGEQQPEADHKLRQEHSDAGYAAGQSYRDARNGWFSVELDTDGLTDLRLLARYRGDEGRKRSFDILVDGTRIATCNNTKLTGRNEFVEVAHPIPADLLQGKRTVRVEFRSHPDNTAGGVYHLRLLRSE